MNDHAHLAKSFSSFETTIIHLFLSFRNFGVQSIYLSNDSLLESIFSKRNFPLLQRHLHWKVSIETHLRCTRFEANLRGELELSFETEFSSRLNSLGERLRFKDALDKQELCALNQFRNAEIRLHLEDESSFVRESGRKLLWSRLTVKLSLFSDEDTTANRYGRESRDQTGLGWLCKSALAWSLKKSIGLKG